MLTYAHLMYQEFGYESKFCTYFLDKKIQITGRVSELVKFVLQSHFAQTHFVTFKFNFNMEINDSYCLNK